jgi:K+-transporting ATPase A subunit
MKKNMGHIDRIIRLVIAVVFAGLYFSGSITGTFGLVLVALSVVFVATSLVGSCPLYLPLGISTLRKKVAGKP